MRRGFGIFLLLLLAFGVRAELGLVLRYDDLSLQSNTDFERRLFAGISQRKGHVLVGIIPFTDGTDGNGQDKWQMVANYVAAGTIEVALHGYQHRHNDRYPGPGKSEFSHLPLAEQQRMIAFGKQYLEGMLSTPIHYFIPPYNSYDTNTLKALRQQEFELISATVHGVAHPAMKFLPGTVYPQDLPMVVKRAKLAGLNRGLVVVTMHPYDFLESGETLPDFRRRRNAHPLTLAEFFRNLDQVLPDVRWVSVTDLVEHMQVGVERFHANKRARDNFWVRRGLLPFHVFNPKRGIYYQASDARRLYGLQVAFGLGFYGGLGIVVAVVGWQFARWRRGSSAAFMVTVLVILMILVLGYKIGRDGPYLRSALLFSAGISWILGYGLGRWFCRKLNLCAASSD